MRVHTQGFKDQIKKLGREIDSKITYGNKVLTSEELYGVYPIINGSLLKSAMKELHFESSTQIPNNVIIKYEFGLKVNDEYEYLGYGIYIVYSSEFNEDTKTYKHTCYDGMLFSMKEYKVLQNGTFPMTVRDYITNLCLDCNLIFKNFNDEFPNYDKIIESDLYANLGYTYRDIFDELSAVTASTICLNSSEQVEVRYITDTNDTIDAEYLKDVNVKFGAKYGPINSIVLSRSAESDNVYLRDEESVNINGLCELKIIDNQIMNDNNRSDYLPDILSKLNGLEYHINDYTSTGILYYEICDKYKIQIEDNTYNCILFNDEPEITQGIVENIFTEMPEETVTDYNKADKNDRKINQTYIMVDKQNQKITAMAETQEEHSSKIAKLEMTDESITQSVNTINNQIIPTSQVSGSYIHVEDSAEAPLINLEIEGKSEQSGESPSPGYPSKIESVGYKNLYDEKISSENYYYNANGVKTSHSYKFINQKITNIDKNMTVSFKEILGAGASNGYVRFFEFDTNDIFIKRTLINSNTTVTLQENTNYVIVSVDADESNAYFEELLITKGTKVHSYIPYGKYGIEVKIKNGNFLENVATSQTKNGVTFTVNEDKSVIVNGISTQQMTYELFSGNTDVLGGKYLVGAPIGSSSTLCLIASYYDENYKWKAEEYDTGNGLLLKRDYPIIIIGILIRNGISVNNQIFKPMIVDNIDTEYEQYQERTSVMLLEQPLRSLPNGVKDIAYIKNNKLYVDRYVGSVILNGSENWLQAATSTSGKYRFRLDGLMSIIKKTSSDSSKASILLSHYKAVSTTDTYTNIQGSSVDTLGHLFIYDNTNASSLTNFKTWLSTHPTQVDYELAEPYNEELGEIEMPSTLKGTTNITTTDELEPTINIEYVRDTTLSSYVEGQLQNERVIREENIAELIIEENQIKESVQTVSGSVDGLKTTVSSATDTLTSQGRLLEIVSTNIDKSTGEVREVTTTTGFTFDAKGMTISDDSGFKGEHTAQGTFYKDGETITGQYTKDGSKQKDLELFGTYSYGKENIDDTPMFIAQLYKDENGEECFGHFYNGGGY